MTGTVGPCAQASGRLSRRPSRCYTHEILKGNDGHCGRVGALCSGVGEAEQATFNLLDEGEDAPDENDHARQELTERYNSEEPIRYFPQNQDPRLEWGATGVRR